MNENPLEHMVSSQQVKEIQQGSLNPIQDGSKGGPGSLNDHLRFSLILPFYTRKENGDRGPVCSQGSAQMSWRVREGIQFNTRLSFSS